MIVIHTPIGYRKISKIFNEEGLLTPRNTPFSPSKVFSIYKKGKIREQRINRPDKMDISPPVIEYFPPEKWLKTPDY